MTPSEVFYAVLDKYKYSGVEPLENWDVDDLIELAEAIRAELHDRDVIMQNEYFDEEDREAFYIDSDDELFPRGTFIEDEGSEE